MKEKFIKPVSVHDVDEDQLAALFRLFRNFYNEVDFDQFSSDFREKDGVFIMWSDDSLPVGFSTFRVDEFELPSGTIRTIFSGDTIIDRDHWGNQILAFSWIREAGVIKGRTPFTPLYWFLIVKGHRTYRYLPVFSKCYYPCPDLATPTDIKKIMDHLATTHFGECYDPGTGIIRFPESKGHLKPTYAAIPKNHMEIPEVRFFLEQNPGYSEGDELGCMTELTEDNQKPLAARIFRKGMQ